MQLKARLVIIWLLYAGLLVWASGAFPGNLTKLAFVLGGSFLGMVLPKLISAAAETYFTSAPLSHFFSLFWQDSYSLMPTTKVGQLIYSYPFLFAFAIVSLYVVTSTDSWFGRALVLGMGLRLVIDLFVSNRDKAVLKQRWFAAFASKLSDTELDVFVYGTLAGFILLTILSLRA